MQTFLLTWNPNRWPEDRLAAVARSFQAGRRRVTSWSVGGRQRGIEKGDRLFLLRQSSEPKGIIASGWAVTEVYPGRHWDYPRRRGKATYVNFAVEALFVPGEEAPLALDLLRREVPRGATWNAQSSGTVIEPQAAARIETLWARHLRRLHVEPRRRPRGKLPARPVAPELQGLEGRETRLMVRHLHREQWLRDEKIQEALRLGGGRLRCEVPSCGFDFEAAYGSLGAGYAQVHHRKPLSHRTAPTKTKLSDLAIVCANCHVMIHRNGECRSLRAVQPRVGGGRSRAGRKA